MAEIVEIKFNDETDEGLKKFSRIVDPVAIDVLIERIKDPSEKRSLSELITAWLEGL